MTNLCIRWERIANEILMYFRSTRKNASEMLLSDVLDTDGDGNSLSLIDILSEDDDMDEQLPFT